MPVDLKVPRYRQPYMECGVTCLAEVMEYFSAEKHDIKDIVKEIGQTYENMDWDFVAGKLAMKRGFKVKVITPSTLHRLKKLSNT